MNIIDRFLDSIQHINNFFTDSTFPEVELSLKEDVKKFLRANSFKRLEDFSTEPMHISFNIHEKDRSIYPLIESMKLFELYEEYAWKKQRLHFQHLVNVYLLGLYVYHNFPPIRDLINVFITNTPNNIRVVEHPQVIHFSSGTIEGEFYYRWRLTSLTHDIGYPIELLSGNEEKLFKYFMNLNAKIRTNLHSLDDMFYYNKINLLNIIDNEISSIDIKKYINIQENEPEFENIVHDHGIYGALLFYHVMHCHFSLYPNYLPRPDGSNIVTTRELLEGPILRMSSAIALHNIEKNKNILAKCIKDNEIIYSLKINPIAYLLKISDELQEWHKISSEDIRQRVIRYDEPLPEVFLDIYFDDDKIIIENFPNDKIDIVYEKMNRFFHPNDILYFK